MADIGTFDAPTWNPLSFFGFEHDALKINAITIKNTWFILAILFVVCFICRLFAKKRSSVVRYVVASGLQSFIDLITQSLGSFFYGHFSFITAIFLFIMLCNCIAVIPWATEPTQDINTALALGLVSFFYKEYYGIKAQGLWTYLQEFFHPFFLMFPVNLIGHFSKVISISFRLFGNIFGGSIIMELYKGAIGGSLLLETFGILSGLNFIILIFFGVFEGLIQAFVFTMLTLTYLTLAIQEEPAAET